VIPDAAVEENRPMTITEFLKARIAEDEERAQRVRRYGLDGGGGFFGAGRVLGECAAKRAIIETQSVPKIVAVPNPFILRALATVYADHPDYRQEWAL